MFLVTPAGQWNYEYANGEDCGNTAHRTTNGTGTNRYFGHKHVYDYSFPATAVDDSMNPRADVTTAMIKARYDWQYGVPDNDGQSPLVTSEGSEDVKTNCYAYVFGYDCWIAG